MRRRHGGGFARERGLPVSIRGGGHSGAGFAVADGALMLDLSGMRSVRVDPSARTVAAGRGTLWSQLDAATGEFGLATTGGVVGSTGIAGLTASMQRASSFRELCAFPSLGQQRT